MWGPGFEWVSAAIALVAAISGMLVGWTARAREVKKETKADAAQDANIRFDIEYIKRGVDDLRAEQRTQKADFHALVERVARVEESGKSLHKRVDRLEGKGP